MTNVVEVNLKKYVDDSFRRELIRFKSKYRDFDKATLMTWFNMQKQNFTKNFKEF
eukprot:CAMPEP_0116898474 /NCGR_PEP_ID=MMETSP0467-20121206/7201_1 /TAXON_ID=283647 /ORGANISM="Mesodinium pulex, Strain SPMC105" /LENGTH=54 /DNA_ID=CAMNT_0004570647 /DNA_START=1023 /DNA_END=1187 /DNA_ORIENTATION=-